MNTLIIGDLHSPFIKDGYLEHCIKIRDKYNCKRIMCTGDMMDNHYSSFHVSDPDGLSAKDEFDEAINALKPWKDAFKGMKVCMGNHDAIPQRKAFDSGISIKWIKTVEEVFNKSGFKSWKFRESWEERGILYVHGLGGKAKQRMLREGTSIVQGHYHSEAHVTFQVTPNDRRFAMQVPCGVDVKSYAMAYGKHFAKPIIGCGVIIDDYTPIIETMRMT